MIAQRAFFTTLAAVFAGALAACQTAGVSGPVRPLDSGVSAKTDDRPKELYLSAIQQLLTYDKYYAAIAYLDEFQRRYGPSGLSRKLRGDAWLALGEYKNAEKEYSTLGGELAGYGRHGVGRIAAAHGDWATAAAHFEEAVRLQPTNTGFLWDFGCALAKMDRAPEAAFELHKALELTGGTTDLPQNSMSDCADEMRMLMRAASAESVPMAP